MAARVVLPVALILATVMVPAAPSGAASPGASAAVRVALPLQKPLPTMKQWRADVRRAMAGTEAWLDHRLAQGVVRPAIVFDVDNTTIATHYAWPRPVTRVLRFASYASRRGVTLLVATGRRAGTLGKVRRALRDAGYHMAMLCGRRVGETTQDGKTRCRRQYSELGYTVLAMVGNRPTDCAGGRYFERCIMLPSYGLKLT